MKSKVLASCLALSLAWAAGLTSAGLAAGYPDRPVTLVLPNSAGGGLDLIARNMAVVLQEQTGQPFIIDNRPGALGEIGERYVAESKPDGYTLLFQNNSLVTRPAVMENRRFKLGEKLVGVAALVTVPSGLAVHPSIPANSVEELYAYIRANPGKHFAYSSCGTGSSIHLIGELLKHVEKVENVEHVSYNGCGPGIADALGGHVPIAFNSVAGMVQHAQAGTLRLLGVTRKIDIEGVKNNIEVFADLPGMELARDADVWSGVFAPVGTPPELIERINEVFAKAASDPRILEYFKKGFQVPLKMTPKEFTDYVNFDFQRWHKIGTRKFDD